MNEQIQKGNYPEVKAVAEGIDENEKKISFHGKRADAIVKNMLLHSRSAVGQKETTDLNALCEEYLRLAYHGLKAKDKTFQSEYSVELDPQLPKISVVPQEMGRVFLNMFNNPFFAVNAKTKTMDRNGGYTPAVKVISKWIKTDSGGQAEIRIKDNGPGIPDEIRNKIFQPFFTTKPTGEGTGLGLSLAYDMVTKGHGGTLEVKTKEGKGSEFIIRIPG